MRDAIASKYRSSQENHWTRTTDVHILKSLIDPHLISLFQLSSKRAEAKEYLRVLQTEISKVLSIPIQLTTPIRVSGCEECQSFHTLQIHENCWLHALVLLLKSLKGNLTKKSQDEVERIYKMLESQNYDKCSFHNFTDEEKHECYNELCKQFFDVGFKPQSEPIGSIDFKNRIDVEDFLSIVCMFLKGSSYTMNIRLINDFLTYELIKSDIQHVQGGLILLLNHVLPFTICKEGGNCTMKILDSKNPSPFGSFPFKPIAEPTQDLGITNHPMQEYTPVWYYNVNVNDWKPGTFTGMTGENYSVNDTDTGTQIDIPGNHLRMRFNLGVHVRAIIKIEQSKT